MSNFGFFKDARSPNMVMLRHPRCDFENFLFCSNSSLISENITKFLVEKLSEVISQKPHREGGMENTPSAFGVKDLNVISLGTLFLGPDGVRYGEVSLYSRLTI